MKKKARSIALEHPDEKSMKCPNCASPLVIRDNVWICFTCAHETPMKERI